MATVFLPGSWVLRLPLAGASLPICLVALLVVPWISVVGSETRGHGHLRRVLEDLGAGAT